MMMGISVKDNEPEFIGVFSENKTDKKELELVFKMVDTLNDWLVDSGYEQHQYKVELNGKKAYIKKEA